LLKYILHRNINNIYARYGRPESGRMGNKIGVVMTLVSTPDVGTDTGDE